MRAYNLLKSKQGFSLLFILALLSASFLLLWGTVASLGTAAIQQKLALDNDKRECTASHIRAVLTALSASQLANRVSGIPSKTAIENALKWSLNRADVTVTLSPTSQQSAASFAFSPLFGVTPLKGMTVLPGQVDVTRGTWRFKMYFGNYSAVGLQLFCPFGLFLNKVSIPMDVDGVCLANGVQSSSNVTSFVCKQMFSPFLSGGVKPTNVQALYIGQQFLNAVVGQNARQLFGITSTLYTSGATRVNFDGNTVSPTLPGITVVDFANAKRLQIVLSQCNVVKLNIQCTTAQAVQNGLILVGSTGVLTLKTLTTNGRLWLKGDHTGSPMVIASTGPSWTFSNAAFTPEAPIQSVLVKWNAYLASGNNRTLFSSPQTCTLEVNGTMSFPGALEGNLQKIAIKRLPTMNTLIPFVEQTELLTKIEIENA